MALVRKNIRQIFSLAHYQYIEWLLNGKQIIVFLILLFMMLHVTNPIITLAESVNIPFHWAEPLLAAMNSIYMIPLILFCFLTLVCDLPKRNYETINFVFHTKRANWYYGQLLLIVYIISTCLTIFYILYFSNTTAILANTPFDTAATTQPMTVAASRIR